ncbi:PREDICTED: uncharacterized protein LOC104599168 isoform X2 [Nelumbo nucifera]|uniref:Uncharacterized protein LOC104599168 isoform X2 n=1 Tax=Nelumbo nucifera TaxID=4432 RepID=A0A1U8A4X1_NELNU|nr:PREDICTED: uncharacterized protein LOC104599168 isoform X2 [Nelumbo nucifera]
MGTTFVLIPISLSTARKPTSAIISARDRIIDFGKYKGKMLGTLPSKYLKWISKNLRARDFEEWAKLADEVLQDPVYRDRLEWEYADKILNGDDSRASRTESPVSDLLEISESFGWNNEDKVAWSRINFELLGTSKGGRIPRNRIKKDEELSGSMKTRLQVSQVEGRVPLKKDLGLEREKKYKVSFLSTDSRDPKIEQMCTFGKDLGLKNEKKSSSLITSSSFLMTKETGVPSKSNLNFQEGKLGLPNKQSVVPDVAVERKVGFLRKGFRVSFAAEGEAFEEESNVTMRREERRERQRLKRSLQLNKLRTEIRGKDKDRANDDDSKIVFQSNKDQAEDKMVVNRSPFPGREALLKKVLSNRRGL